MTRREELLRTATALLTADRAYWRTIEHTKAGAEAAVEFAGWVLEAVDRRHPAEETKRGGPEDR